MLIPPLQVQMERSLFERLQQQGAPVKMLSVQYRMHPAIRQVSMLSVPSVHYRMRPCPAEPLHACLLLPPCNRAMDRGIPEGRNWHGAVNRSSFVGSSVPPHAVRECCPCCPGPHPRPHTYAKARHPIFLHRHIPSSSPTPTKNNPLLPRSSPRHTSTAGACATPTASGTCPLPPSTATP